MKNSFSIELKYNQILELVRQLPKKDKLKLSKELEKELIESKWRSLLKAFQTDDLDQETIDQEVETVRQHLYDARKKK